MAFLRGTTADADGTLGSAVIKRNGKSRDGEQIKRKWLKDVIALLLRDPLPPSQVRYDSPVGIHGVFLLTAPPSGSG